MKYEIKDEELRLFYGEFEIIDLNKDDNLPFGDIWNKSSKSFNMKYYNSDFSSIGLEIYPQDFMETQRYVYAALMPVNKEEGLDKEKIYKLEPGNYIKFETTFGELTKGFIKEVYGYIRVNNLPVDYSFDYEEYPKEFRHDDPNSIVYLCWKYLGTK